MSYEEIYSIVKLFYENFGLKKVRFTGGEPLIRRDAEKIFRKIAEFPLELAITTNGYFLHRYLDLFKEIGLKNINISLDSLNPEKFNKIVGKNAFRRVMSNIFSAVLQDFNVKINVVVIRGVNDSEIIDFLKLTEKHEIDVRFIEYMPFSDNSWELQKVFSYKEMLQTVSAKYQVEKLPELSNATSRRFRVKGFAGTFSVIASVSFPFCSGCNRLRLTSDGKLVNCLFSPVKYDLLTPFRKGENILPIIEEAVLLKARSRGGLPRFDKINQVVVSNRMQSLGG